jgi:glycosyltransferase involved in cell wall biosynthesis
VTALPSISVIVPVRDDAEKLRRCLASIRANQYEGAIDIIVVDNGSRDQSVAVARDARATVVILPGSRVSELRNAGATRATGDIFAFVDADHVIDESWMAAAAELLTQADVAAAGAPYVTPPGGNWVQRAYDRFRMRHRGTHDVEWLGSGNLAVRHRVFVEVGGFDTSLETCEDVDLCNRLRRRYRIVSDDRLRSVHFGDPSTLTALFFGELWRGRDNFPATMRGPLSLRSISSLVAPIANLFFIAAIVVGAIAGPWLGPELFLVGTGGVAVLTICRAAQLTFNADDAMARDVLPNLAVACTYNVARALALVLRATHRRRKAAEA